jgi:F0F1-type ATP synthase assembly protein I
VTNERRRRAASYRRLADASAIGLAFPIAIAIGYFFGQFLDDALGIAPWGTYIFTVIGVGAGFLNAIRMALRLGGEEDEEIHRGGGQ